MNVTLRVAVLALGFLSFCKSSDIESDLDDAKEAINKIAKLSPVEEYLDLLTSLHEWGARSVLSTAMTVYTLTADDMDWSDDEVSLGMWNKYKNFKSAIGNLKSKVSHQKLEKLPSDLRSADSQMEDMEQKIEEIINNSALADQERKTFFMMYEKDYIDISDKLYATMTSESNSIFSITQKDLRNDKKGTFEVVIKTTVMLLQSVNIDTTYKLLKMQSEDELEDILEEISSKWENNFAKLGEIISNLNKNIEESWENQYQYDVDSYFETEKSKDSNVMAQNLRGLLQEKFYWRTWFVVVTDISKNDVEINTCNGLNKKIGKNQVFVSSGDAKSTFNKKLARETLQKAKDAVNLFFTPKRAHEINQKISAKCTDFKMFGTVHENAGINGDNERIEVMETSTKRFWLFEKRHFKSFIMG